MREFWKRRGVLRTVGGGVGGLSVLESTTATAQDESKAAVTFEDQTTDGREVVVAHVRTTVDAMYRVRAVHHDERHAGGTIRAGTDVREFTVRLDEPLTDDRELRFSLYPIDGGSSIAMDTATVAVSDDVTYVDGLPVTRVDADPDEGFHYPYFLTAPPVPESEAGGPILVEPNNTGTATDDFQRHEDRARRLITDGPSRRISGNLGVPLLVPVFPRPRSDPVDGTHYVHQLDRDTLRISGGPLERIDRQLLRMVEHARGKLAAEGYPVGDDIILNGFSASGNFVDRFTVLHPERVVSVTAGGLNGMALLPLTERDGRTLNYHVGIADVEELTGEPVDLDALDDVNQFLYMGAQDTNDTIPYTDAWTSDELRRTALDVYGDDMITDRFPTCQAAYETAGVEAQFRVYDGVGHTPRPAMDDIVEFHRRSIEGEDVSEFGQRLGLVAAVEHAPASPGDGEPVEFDATGSRLGRGEIIAYTWDFDDGGTAAGSVVTHTFEEPGDYSVRLRVIDEHGRTADTTLELAVGGGNTTARTTAAPTTSTADTETTGSTGTGTSPVEASQGVGGAAETSSTSAPGFGVGTALTGLGGTLYLLSRRLKRDSEE